MNECVHKVNDIITTVYGGQQCRNLPHTGSDMVMMFSIGIALVLAGMVIWACTCD